MCNFTCPSSGASSLSIEPMGKRKTTTLIAINAMVTTGQRRAVIFSCLMGSNIFPSLARQPRAYSRQCSFAAGSFPDDSGTVPIFSNQRELDVRGRLAQLVSGCVESDCFAGGPAQE